MATPIGLTRWYHRHFGYHTRFYIAVLVTIVVVAYVLVPHVARFLDAAAGYNPPVFEPKDAARQNWLDSRGAVIGLPSISSAVVVNILLFLLVVIVWLAIVPPGASRRR